LLVLWLHLGLLLIIQQNVDVDLLEIEKQALIIEQSKQMAKNLRLDDSENIEFASERPKAHLTITEYDSVFEVMDDCSGSKDLYELSRNAWVAIGDQACVLAVKNGSIKVEQGEDGKLTLSLRAIINDDRSIPFYHLGIWCARLRKVLPNRYGKSIYTKPQELPITGDTRDQAIKAVDTYVKSYYKSSTQNSQWVLRNAKFRQEPATEAQIQVLRKRFGMKVVDGSLTKGQAMNLFARMQEGQGKIWRKQAENRRAVALEIEERAKAGLLRRK
jgi:ATP-dependent helicase IRC3